MACENANITTLQKNKIALILLCALENRFFFSNYIYQNFNGMTTILIFVEEESQVDIPFIFIEEALIPSKG